CAARGMAALRHHRLLRRPHDLLDVLRRSGGVVAEWASALGAGRSGDTRRRLAPHDRGRNGHGLLGTRNRELAGLRQGRQSYARWGCAAADERPTAWPGYKI